MEMHMVPLCSRRNLGYAQREGLPMTGVAILIHRSRPVQYDDHLHIHDVSKRQGRIISVGMKWLEQAVL